MYASIYNVRVATQQDADALRLLADLDSQSALTGRALMGEIGGSPAAALSLSDGRVIADPFRHTAHLVSCLRTQAGAMQAYEATPSLAERMLATLPVSLRARATTVSASI